MNKPDKKDAVKALIYTQKFKIEGGIHIVFRDSYRGRLSDHLNSNSAPAFIAVVDAVIYDYNDKVVSKNSCVIVNRSHIDTIIEIEEEA